MEESIGAIYFEPDDFSGHIICLVGVDIQFFPERLPTEALQCFFRFYRDVLRKKPPAENSKAYDQR